MKLLGTPLLQQNFKTLIGDVKTLIGECQEEHRNT